MFTIKKILRKIIPKYIFEKVLAWNQKSIIYDRFMCNLLRMAKHPERFLSQKVFTDDDELYLAQMSKYDKVKIYGVPFHIIGHFCLDYKWIFNERRKKTNYMYVIMPYYIYTKNISEVPNSFLYKKMQEKITCIDEDNIYFWYEFITNNIDKIEFYDSSYIDSELTSLARSYYSSKIVQEENGSCIDFSTTEISVGREKTVDLGITGEYICIFSRDGSYKKELHSDTNQARNSDINKFKLLSSVFFSKYNLQSVRMGAVVDKPFNVCGSIDYANCGRSEFLDVYIFQNSLFSIGDMSGIFNIPDLLGKPIAAINVPAILHIGEPRGFANIVAFKNIYDKRKQRNLSLRERIELEIKIKEKNPKYQGMSMLYAYMGEEDLIFVDNSEEEILSIAEEMYHLILTGTTSLAYETDNQRKYREIVNEMTSAYSDYTGSFWKISEGWLKFNPSFLG